MLFEQFSDLLGTGEQLHLTVTKTGDGQLKLLVTPILDHPPDNLSDEAAQVRAALAQPLVVSATAADLDGATGTGFMTLLADYAATRTGLKNSLDTLSTLKAAAASASVAAVKARQQSGAAAAPAKGQDSPPAPPPAPAAAAIPPPQAPVAPPATTNPDSLF